MNSHHVEEYDLEETTSHHVVSLKVGPHVPRGLYGGWTIHHSYHLEELGPAQLCDVAGDAEVPQPSGRQAGRDIHLTRNHGYNDGYN